MNNALNHVSSGVPIKDIVILIPAYQPDDALCSYVNELIEAGAERIIVVDDGGGETYRSLFAEVEAHPECTLLVHEVNRGKGAALKTGLTYYRKHFETKGFLGVVTADADGQHTTKDLIAVADRFSLPSDRESLILGERSFSETKIPFKSKLGNSLTTLLFSLLYGLRIHDTQTGLRGIPNALIDDFIDLDGDRYEYEMNMLMICSKKKIPIDSVTITTIYMDENAGTHFDPIKDSFRIYRLLLGGFFRFIMTALISTVIDLVLFQIFIVMFESTTGSYILIATVLSRAVSSFTNFMLNKIFVFEHHGHALSSAFRYYILVIVNMLLSAGLVTLGTEITPLPALPVKIIVDTILFFVSYRLQKSAVFKEDN